MMVYCSSISLLQAYLFHKLRLSNQNRVESRTWIFHLPSHKDYRDVCYPYILRGSISYIVLFSSDSYSINNSEVCLAYAVGASSTEHYPDRSILYTLLPSSKYPWVVNTGQVEGTLIMICMSTCYTKLFLVILLLLKSIYNH